MWTCALKGSHGKGTPRKHSNSDMRIIFFYRIWLKNPVLLRHLLENSTNRTIQFKIVRIQKRCIDCQNQQLNFQRHQTFRWNVKMCLWNDISCSKMQMTEAATAKTNKTQYTISKITQTSMCIHCIRPKAYTYEIVRCWVKVALSCVLFHSRLKTHLFVSRSLSVCRIKAQK